MKQLYVFASLLLASTAASAQQSISTLPPPVLVDPKIAALRDDALANDHYAWDVVEGLTTEVGQRLAATEAEARARDWAGWKPEFSLEEGLRKTAEWVEGNLSSLRVRGYHV